MDLTCSLKFIHTGSHRERLAKLFSRQLTWRLLISIFPLPRRTRSFRSSASKIPKMHKRMDTFARPFHSVPSDLYFTSTDSRGSWRKSCLNWRSWRQTILMTIPIGFLAGSGQKHGNRQWDMLWNFLASTRLKTRSCLLNGRRTCLAWRLWFDWQRWQMRQGVQQGKSSLGNDGSSW